MQANWPIKISHYIMSNETIQRFSKPIFYPPASISNQTVYAYSHNSITHSLLAYTTQGLVLYSLEQNKVIKTRQLPNKQDTHSYYTSPQPLLLLNIWVLLKNKTTICALDSNLDTIAECPTATPLESISVYHKEHIIAGLTASRQRLMLWVFQRQVQNNEIIKNEFAFVGSISFNYTIMNTVISNELGILGFCSESAMEISIWDASKFATLFIIDLINNQKSDPIHLIIGNGKTI